MCVLNQLLLTARKLGLFAKHLSCTPRVIRGWRISQTFWRNAGLCPVAERESTRRERLLSFPIRSTLDYSNIVVNSTRENTSQSSQRNFLIRRKRFYASVESRGINRKMNRKHFAALSLAPNVE